MIVHYQHKITWFVGVFQVVYLIYWGLIVFSLLISLYIVVFLLLRSGSSSRKKSITPRSIWVYECENCRVSLPKDVLYSCCSEICCRIQQFYCERATSLPSLAQKCAHLFVFLIEQMVILFCVSFWLILACAYHARTQQGFCTFCFHNLHTRGLFHHNFRRKNVGDFLEKVQRFSENLPRFLEKVQCFWRKVRVFFFYSSSIIEISSEASEIMR